MQQLLRALHVFFVQMHEGIVHDDEGLFRFVHIIHERKAQAQRQERAFPRAQMPIAPRFAAPLEYDLEILIHAHLFPEHLLKRLRIREKPRFDGGDILVLQRLLRTRQRRHGIGNQVVFLLALL